MDSVYKKIAMVSGELAKHGISKDNVNQQQKFKFRGIDDVYNALAPLLAKCGLCILPRVVSSERDEKPSRSGGTLFYCRLTVEFDFVSADDGSKHTVVTIGEAMDSADKASNKAMAAAYKYAAFMTFCIPTEGDNDADATTHYPQQHRQQQQQKPKQQQQQSNVSKEQLKRLFAMIGGFAGENGLDSKQTRGLQENFKRAINSDEYLMLSIESSTEIPSSAYDYITGKGFESLCNSALALTVNQLGE